MPRIKYSEDGGKKRLLVMARVHSSCNGQMHRALPPVTASWATAACERHGSQEREGHDSPAGSGALASLGASVIGRRELAMRKKGQP